MSCQKINNSNKKLEEVEEENSNNTADTVSATTTTTVNSKKQTLNADDNNDTAAVENIPKNAKRPKLDEIYQKLEDNTKWKLKAILKDELVREIPLCDIVIGKIAERKEAATLMKNLPPLPKNLTHLKRVRAKYGFLQIIIQEASEDRSENLIDLIKENCLKEENKTNYKGLDVDSIKIVQVSSSIPLTVRQHNSVNSFWPCNFYPDKQIEKLLNESDNCGFTEIDVQIIKNNIKLVLEKSNFNERDERPACLIFDSKEVQNNVLTCVFGESDHPIKHCIMIAIDNISKIQGGTGAWNKNEKINYKGRVRDKHEDYICTGLDAYLSHEPCFMCAMALLHSRVKRIFFVKNSPNFGSLESITKIHCLPNVNHRFEVFQFKFL